MLQNSLSKLPFKTSLSPDLYALKEENTDGIELFLTGAAKSHSCRSSSDLFAEAFALSCFYKKAYLLFDMIGFENCLLGKYPQK